MEGGDDMVGTYHPTFEIRVARASSGDCNVTRLHTKNKRRKINVPLTAVLQSQIKLTS